MKTRVTLRDIAKVAKVHFTTVGMALRGDNRTAPETAARILAIAKKMDYRPDPVLSALADYRTKGRRIFHGIIGYVFTTPLARVTAGYRAAYLSARAHADLLGFAIESFEFPPGLNGAAQLQRILHARSIQSLILSPLPVPGSFPFFPWNRFAVSAIGQSITSPLFHRVCNHQSHSIRQQLDRVRELGYRRVGLALSRNATFRTEHNYLSAYLAERQFDSANVIASPFIFEQLDPQAFSAWLGEARPDCILASEPDTLNCLSQLGYGVPRDIGFALVASRPELPAIAGPLENWEALGEAAVDNVISLLAKREYGVPTSPRTMLVECLAWQTGETLARKSSSRTPNAGQRPQQKKQPSGDSADA